MHWILLIGGEAARASGKIVHRASLQQCSSQQLGDTIDQSMQNIYSSPDGLEPPSPHLQTWALGFQVEDASIIEKKVLSEMRHRMERLAIPWKYDAYYEDGPEGSSTSNLLSREKCQAWLQSVADHLMDSKVEAEIALYEFTDRPEGFVKPDVPQDQDPFRRATVSMFRKKTCIEALPGPKHIVTNLPAVNPTVAFKPADRPPAVAADNGAGPSRPAKTVNGKQDYKTALDSARALKVIGIRAALQYNGYPSDVIEDLIQNKLYLWHASNMISFHWRLKLPNELTARTYPDIDANPYPGGKITEKSARKCFRSNACTLPFAHEGRCLLNAALELDANDPLNQQIERATTTVRTALIYAGYPPEVVDTMMENDFHVSVYPYSKSSKYRWSLKLFNGKRVDSLIKISNCRYPGGKAVVNPICLTVGCGKRLGHRGSCQGYYRRRYQAEQEADTESASPYYAKKKSRAASPSSLPSGSILSSSSDDEDFDGNEALFSEEEDSEDYAGSLGFSDSMEGDSSGSEQEEDLNNGLSRPKSLAAKVSPAGASRHVERGDALVGDDGAGPSRPSMPAGEKENSQSALDTARTSRIAGIRASLHYSGYPSDVIEDLIQNKLSLYRQPVGNRFAFILKLPNGTSAHSYATVDANPYPGGKITEKSARKCHKSDDCTKPFGHTNACCLLSTTLDASSIIQHATTGVRAALIYAGYPIEVVDTMMENDFHITVYPNGSYAWSVKLFNRKHVRSLTEILKHPYPGGKVAVNPICPTVGCGRKFGHNGGCRGPNAPHFQVKRKADPVARSSPVRTRSRAISPMRNQHSRSILSSSSDDEEEQEEIEEGDKEQPREEESPIYLLTTEDEEDSDFQGEDDMSNGTNNASQTSTPPSPGDVSIDAYPKGVALICTNLTYSVKTSKKKILTILNDVSLYLSPGELTAFLGPSGCGKTSVLDCLSGRKTYGIIDPKAVIHYNGVPASQDYLRKNVGYTEQQDTLLSMLTPFEMLLYTAELKHSRHQPLSEKKAQVAKLITQLGLEDCQNTRIGNPSKRLISGGEAKRVNIGLALITNPQVLFIDELTSGLDSFTAHNTVEVVHKLKESGITICASIHSPPPYTFQLFDRVLVLQRGSVVYFGENGNAVFEYFKSSFPVGLRERRDSEGVADFLLDVTTRVNYDPEKAAVFADAYRRSSLAEENMQKIKEIEEKFKIAGGAVGGENGNGKKKQIEKPVESDLEAAAGTTKSAASTSTLSLSPPTTTKTTSKSFSDVDLGPTSTPAWWALLILFKYRSLKSYRSSSFIAPRTGDKFMIVFLVVTIWWGKGDDPQAATGILFLWSMLSAFTSMGILPTIVLERPVFRRERADGCYTPGAYTFYKLLEEMLPQIPAGLIYSALVFYLVDLQGSFLVFWLVYVVSTANSVACTMLVSACSPNTSVAGALMSSYATTLFFFSGYLIPYSSIPVYWQWYATIDYLRYSFGSMMANQFPNSAESAAAVQGAPAFNPLEFYDLEGVNRWTWLGYQAIFFPVFTVFLWSALKWLQHTKR